MTGVSPGLEDEQGRDRKTEERESADQEGRQPGVTGGRTGRCRLWQMCGLEPHRMAGRCWARTRGSGPSGELQVDTESAVRKRC